MPNQSGLLISLFAAGFAAVSLAQEAPKKQFTARELFYSAASAPGPARPQSQSAPSKTTTAKRVPTETAAAQPAPPASRPQTGNPKGATAPSQSSAPIVMAIDQTADQRPSSAPAPSAGVALGLKYTLLKRIGDEMAEVAPSAVFRAGDRIQLKVETNLPGYLYIINQGSSGTWKPMFPSADVADGNNRVEGMRPYAMPPGTNMVFDEQVGTEKIFIVFSREPEQDLEKIIYSLQNTNAKPVATPDAPPAPKQIVQYARANIDNATVGRLRNFHSRDLIIERVNPNTPGGAKKETAVYVVNASGSASSRVVADISLVHQ
jgi:hypothetical protein